VPILLENGFLVQSNERIDQSKEHLHMHLQQFLFKLEIDIKKKNNNKLK